MIVQLNKRDNCCHGQEIWPILQMFSLNTLSASVSRIIWLPWIVAWFPCEGKQHHYIVKLLNHVTVLKPQMKKKIAHKFKNMQVKFFTFLLQFSFRFVTRSYKLYLEKSLFSPYFPSVKVCPWAKLARNYKIFPFEFLNKRKRHER